MNTSKKTYRLFSMFMVILVAVSITLPSELLAVHCDMGAQQSSKSEMIDEYCPHMEVHSSNDRHDHQNENDSNWTLSCACDLDQKQITAEVIPTITKTAKLFVVSVTRFIDFVPIDTPTFFSDTEFSPHTEFVPLFLLNSVFLN